MRGPAELMNVRERERAALLLHPLRLRILEQAGEPVSAAEIARRIGEAPQKVNYHVGALAAAGFLEPAGERRRRNFVERRYRATARRYVISPEVLGEVGLPAGGPANAGDAFSAARLLGLTAVVQGELAESLREAEAAGAGRIPTLSLDAEVRFASAGERARFAADLRDAVLAVVARYGGEGRGWPYRLVLGCYPLPREGGGAAEGGEAGRRPDAAESGPARGYPERNEEA